MKKVSLMFRFLMDKIKGQKENRKKNLFSKDYHLKPENDNRNIFAKILDYSAWRIIMFCISFLFLYLKTSQLYLSIAVTLIIVVVFHNIVIRSRNHRFQQIRAQKRQYIASQKIYNQIMNKTVDEMKNYIKKIFAPMGFKRFEFIENSQNHILLKTLYKDNETMILFNMYKNDFDVELKEIKEFVYNMVDNKINKGVLVTTSDFTDSSYDFVNKLNENYTILLVNKKQLLKIIKKGGFFPNEKEIDEIIESKINKNKNKLGKYKNRILSKNKIKEYIILGLYLILIAWYTPYVVYYMIVASFTLALAFISFIFNTIYGFETEEIESVDFEKLLDNM